MDINRTRVLDLIYQSEKGFSDHPRDPGGPTQDGITQRTLSAFEHRQVGVEELKALTEAERNQIYTEQYLAPVRFDDLRTGLDYCVADCAVNSGPGRAARLLQEALGMKGRDLDGIIGARTIDAMNRAKDLDGLIETYCAARLDFCKKLDTWDVFGNGWTHRIGVVQGEALRFAHGNAAPAPSADRATMPETASAKADGAVRVTATPSGQSALATIGSVAGVAVIAAGQATGMLQAYGDVHVVRYLLIGLAVIGATATFLQALTRAKGGATT